LDNLLHLLTELLGCRLHDGRHFGPALVLIFFALPFLPNILPNSYRDFSCPAEANGVSDMADQGLAKAFQ
jgi:hypothetical protein